MDFNNFEDLIKAVIAAFRIKKKSISIFPKFKQSQEIKSINDFFDCEFSSFFVKDYLFVNRYQFYVIGIKVT